MHVNDGLTSQVESRGADGQSWTDYVTAYKAADDLGYKKFLPATCSKCLKQAQENLAAVSPDEDFLNAST